MDEKKRGKSVSLGQMIEAHKKDNVRIKALTDQVKALEDAGGEPNVITGVKVNGVAAEVAEKAVNITVPTKASDLENDAKYQTDEDVADAINTKLSRIYKPGGSAAFADLPELTEANLGLVVNVTEKFTTTDSFLDGAGKKYPAGTNVAVVLVGEEYKYDALAGFVDLSGLQEKEAGKGLSSNDFTDEEKEKLAGIEFASDEEVAAALDEIYSEIYGEGENEM